MDFFSEVIKETIILSIDSLILGFCIRQLHKCHHIISSLEAAPVLEIDENLVSELNKYPNQTIPYAVIRGIVKPLGEPIKSNYNDGVTGVVRRVTLREHVVARTSAGLWSEQARTLHEAVSSAPFLLERAAPAPAPARNAARTALPAVEVVDALQAELIDMDVTYDKFEPVSPGVVEHVWGFFAGVRQRGLQTLEEMVRTGSCLTAVGEVCGVGAAAAGGAGGAGVRLVRVQPARRGLPLYLSTGPRGALLKRLETSRDLLRVLTAVSGALAVAVSCRVLAKWVSRRRRRAQADATRAKLAHARKLRRAAEPHAPPHDDAHACIVCTDNPKEIILLPCGHVCVCEKCSERLGDSCPVCRQRIDSRAAAFIA